MEIDEAVPKPKPLSPTVRFLKSEMERQHLTAQQLAEKAGVSMTNLYAVFRGETSPTIATIEAVAAALKLKITLNGK